jgi:hypothetical protein
MIKYFTPQRLAVAGAGSSRNNPGIQVRFTENRHGDLCLRDGDRILLRRRLSARREQRVLLPLPAMTELRESARL